MELGLTDKRFLVTGGTRGIGKAVVDGLLAEGAAVAYCARTAGAVSDTECELTATGATAIGTTVDVGDAAALKKWVDDSATALGGLDGVVANVSALAIPDNQENWRTSFDVDLMGTIGLVEAALPYLLTSGSGSVVTISSVSGREIDFAAGPYGTMKAAIIHYTQGLAHNLAAKGVRANTVSPGSTDTAILAESARLYGLSDGTAFAPQQPIERLIAADEVATVIAWLAGPDSGAVTGSDHAVDGGLSI